MLNKHTLTEEKEDFRYYHVGKNAIKRAELAHSILLNCSAIMVIPNALENQST